jgi:hypothetical protein
MPKRSSKPGDVNSLAHAIVHEMTNDDGAAAKPSVRMKNAAAVELGRLGGKKGGKARAEALSPEDRKRIAKDAAAARWGPPKGDGVVRAGLTNVMK